MEKSTLKYYVFVRGCLQFGIVAAGLFLGLTTIAAWPNVSLTVNHLLIALYAPLFGMVMGLAMYYIDKKRRK
jgi:hypothetical protein